MLARLHLLCHTCMKHDVYPRGLARVTCGGQQDKGHGLWGPCQLSVLLGGWWHWVICAGFLPRGHQALSPHCCSVCSWHWHSRPRQRPLSPALLLESCMYCGFLACCSILSPLFCCFSRYFYTCALHGYLCLVSFVTPCCRTSILPIAGSYF